MRPEVVVANSVPATCTRVFGVDFTAPLALHSVSVGYAAGTIFVIIGKLLSAVKHVAAKQQEDEKLVNKQAVPFLH